MPDFTNFVYFRIIGDFPSNTVQCQILLIWFTEILLVTVAPPLETLLTRFRKLQPSPLEVGDHLIIRIIRYLTIFSKKTHDSIVI